MSSNSLIKELTTEEELSLEKNIVWIFGTGINKNILNKIFQNKTNVLYEPNIGSHLDKLSWKNDQIISIVEQTSDRSGGRQYDYFFNPGYKEIWSYFLKKLILNRIYSQFQNINEKIIISESNGAFASQKIASLFKNSKIILVFDQAEAIISSQVDDFIKNQKMAWMGGKPIHYSNRILLINYFAKKWNYLMKNFVQTLDLFPKNSSKLIRFDELKKNPTKILQEIYGFIGIDVEKAEIEKISKQIVDLHYDKKMKIFDEKEKELLSSILDIEGRFKDE